MPCFNKASVIAAPVLPAKWTTQVMENLKAILREAGTDLNHVVKASIFLRDMHDYAKVNKVYAGYFTAPYPARETIQVVALPMFVNIEISVIASV
ncbi:MAG TPA: Rid family hydrolase [Puia sp.]|nr:Rid family hydrolase [Puia sp.]